MDEATRGEVDAWLAKAQRDLDSAYRLIAGNPPYRDTAAYHCQQSAEKSLKALLTATGTPFPKTHDLTVLVELAASSDKDAAKWEETAIVLTPYATLYRYPDACPEPDDEDLREALRLSDSLLADARRKLSAL